MIYTNANDWVAAVINQIGWIGISAMAWRLSARITRIETLLTNHVEHISKAIDRIEDRLDRIQK